MCIRDRQSTWEYVAMMTPLHTLERTKNTVMCLARVLKNLLMTVNTVEGEGGPSLHRSLSSGDKSKSGTGEKKNAEAMRQIQREFEMKRKVFLAKQAEMNAEMIDELEKEKEEALCLLCRGKLGKGEESFGYIALLTKSNIRKHMVHGNFLRSIPRQSDAKTIELMSEFKDVKHEYWNLKEMAFNLQTCGHMLHIKCHFEYLQKRPDYTCPACTSMQNVLIPCMSLAADKKVDVLLNEGNYGLSLIHI
eukprot:TRINITY_DN27101_c0_g1_i2.p1 TRINITY_DN27101_c0_g1~~TRINITY_DN27101_c0_g1_i2.p1  ORF type:complete len:267 (-),score=71.39 TRINITY_DN27101_c0_g1_i2:58-801(-)